MNDDYEYFDIDKEFDTYYEKYGNDPLFDNYEFNNNENDKEN